MKEYKFENTHFASSMRERFKKEDLTYIKPFLDEIKFLADCLQSDDVILSMHEAKEKGLTFREIVKVQLKKSFRNL